MPSLSTSMRVALAQTCPLSASAGEIPHADSIFRVLEHNLADARVQVERAAKEGADVVVFPEYFLQGLLDEGRQYLAYPAQHLADYLSGLAVRHSISIVGTIVFPVFRKEHQLPNVSPFGEEQGDGTALQEWEAFVSKYPGKNHDPELQNTAFYLEGGTGEMTGKFIKRNLWHPERTYLTAGQVEHQVFDTKWGKCGFLICWDVSHPSAGQALADLGVDIVFAPTYWIGYDSAPTIDKHHANPPAYETEILSSLSCVRAFETESVWIMCNPGGSAAEGYIGGSGVWMPLKGKLAGVNGVEAGFEVVNVDLTVLKDARKLYKIRTENNR